MDSGYILKKESSELIDELDVHGREEKSRTSLCRTEQLEGRVAGLQTR